MVDCNSIMRNYSRYMLIIFNFFFVLTGVIIVSIGVSAKAYYHEFDDLLDDRYFYISNVFILVGAIIFFIAIFGCCGAAKENACLTTTFSVFLILIFIFEVMLGITGVILRNKTEEFLESTLNQTMSEYMKNEEMAKTWDLVQQQMHCCGITKFTDWYAILNGSLPISCCEIPSPTVKTFTCIDTPNNTLYREGCLSAFGDKIRENTSSFEIAGLTLAVVQLLGIMFSCYLAKQIRSDYETV